MWSDESRLCRFADTQQRQTRNKHVVARDASQCAELTRRLLLRRDCSIRQSHFLRSVCRRPGCVWRAWRQWRSPHGRGRILRPIDAQTRRVEQQAERERRDRRAFSTRHFRLSAGSAQLAQCCCVSSAAAQSSASTLADSLDRRIAMRAIAIACALSAAVSAGPVQNVFDGLLKSTAGVAAAPARSFWPPWAPRPPEPPRSIDLSQYTIGQVRSWTHTLN